MNKYTLLLLLLITISLFLHLWNLDYPEAYYFDEYYSVFTAQQLAVSNRFELWQPTLKPIDPPRGYEWQHPPLTRTLIATAILIFGDHSWVWRLTSLIAGITSIALIYLIGKNLFSQNVGVLAAFLFAIDGLNFAQSRIATRDALLVSLLLTSLYLILKKRVLLSLIFTGFALATKWSAAPLFLLLPLVNRTTNPQVGIKITNLAIFLLIPLIIYIFSYLPFFSLGNNPMDFINLQIATVNHMQDHAVLETRIHPYRSLWWQWPFGFKPIAHYFDQNHQIWAMPNFIVFWLGLLALANTTKTVLNQRSKTKQNKKYTSTLLLLTGYTIFLLPWVLIYLLNRSTSASYLHYYLPSLPFLHIMTASWIIKLIHQKGIRRTFALASLGVSTALFITIYPLLNGM